MKRKIISADLQPACGYVCVHTQACGQVKLWWGFIAVCFLVLPQCEFFSKKSLHFFAVKISVLLLAVASVVPHALCELLVVFCHAETFTTIIRVTAVSLLFITIYLFFFKVEMYQTESFRE